MSFLVLLAMFGAMIYVPLLMQVVHGFSATRSGLAMTPMMGGVLVASIGGGRMISRLGRYRIFPIVGTVLMATGIGLLSEIHATTPYVWLACAMLVLGVGIGLVMPVLVLAVQNAVDPRDMGTATASTMFFRQIGGSFGVAIFGAILANRLGYWLPRELPARFHITASKAGVLLHRSPAELRKLPPAVHTGLVDAFANSLHTVFLFAVPFGIAGFVVALLLKEVPLRGRGAEPVVAAIADPSGEAAA
jgi:MFS family permease